jgi:hypothetical protein
MKPMLVLIAALLMQADIPHPFFASSREWYDIKKIGVVDLHQPGPMKSDYLLRLPKLDEKSMGYLDQHVFKLQVYDESNAILFPLKRADSALVIEDSDKPLWLANYPTKDLVDDTRVILLGAIKVTGTHSYDTAFGQKTIREIQFLKKDESDAIVKKAMDELAEFKKSKEPRFMTLKSKAGTEVEAKFVAFANNKVELKTKDGRTLKLGLDVFTKETADELRKYIREYRAKK